MSQTPTPDPANAHLPSSYQAQLDTEASDWLTAIQRGLSAALVSLDFAHAGLHWCAQLSQFQSLGYAIPVATRVSLVRTLYAMVTYTFVVEEEEEAAAADDEDVESRPLEEEETRSSSRSAKQRQYQRVRRCYVDGPVQRGLARALTNLLQRAWYEPALPGLQLEWRPLVDVLRAAYFKKTSGYTIYDRSHYEAMVSLVRSARQYWRDDAGNGDEDEGVEAAEAGAGHAAASGGDGGAGGGRTATAAICDLFFPYVVPHETRAATAHGFFCTFVPTRGDGGVRDMSAEIGSWFEAGLAMWEWCADAIEYDACWFSVYGRAVYDCATLVVEKSQIDFLFDRALRTLGLPLASRAQPSLTSLEHTYRIFLPRGKTVSITMSGIARVITYTYPQNTAQLSQLMGVVAHYFHPSNQGARWSRHLSLLLEHLATQFAFRIFRQSRGSVGETAATRPMELDQASMDSFVSLLVPSLQLALHSPSNSMVSAATVAALRLAHVSPPIMTLLFSWVQPALTTIDRSHQVMSALQLLSRLAHPISAPDLCVHGVEYVQTLLTLVLPAIDINDQAKAALAMRVLYGVFCCVPLRDPASKPGFFSEWVPQFLDRILALLPSIGSESHTRTLGQFDVIMDQFFQQLSPELHELVLSRLSQFVHTNMLPLALSAVGDMCAAAAYAQPEATLAALVPPAVERIHVEIAFYRKHTTEEEREESIDSGLETTVQWHLNLLSACLHRAGSSIVAHADAIMGAVEETLTLRSKRVVRRASLTLKLMLNGLCDTYPLDTASVNPSVRRSDEFVNASDMHPFWSPAVMEYDDLEVEWHLPSEEERACAWRVVERFALPAMAKLEEHTKYAKHEVWKQWRVLVQIMRGASFLINELAPAENTTTTGKPFRRHALAGGDESPAYARHEEPCLSEGLCSLDTRFVEVGRIAEEGVEALRLRVGELCHRYIEASIESSSDDTQSLRVVCHLLGDLFSTRGCTLSTLQAVRKTHTAARHTQFNSIIEAYPRPMLVTRVYVQHLQRLAVHGGARPYHPLYRTLLHDLVRLSFDRYRSVRRAALSAFRHCVSGFQELLPELCPVFIDAIRLDFAGDEPEDEDADGDADGEELAGEREDDEDLGSRSDEVTKGAISVLKGYTWFISRDWMLTVQFMLSILLTSHKKTDQVQKRLSKLFMRFYNSYSRPHLHMVPPSDELMTQWRCDGFFEPLVHLPDLSARIVASRERLEAQRVERVRLNTLALRALTSLADDSSLNWRYRMWVHSCIFMLLRPSQPVPVNYVKVLLDGYAHTSVHVHSSCRNSLNLLLDAAKPRREKVRTDESSDEYVLTMDDMLELVKFPRTSAEWEAARFRDQCQYSWNGKRADGFYYGEMAVEPDFPFGRTVLRGCEADARQVLESLLYEPEPGKRGVSIPQAEPERVPNDVVLEYITSPAWLAQLLLHVKAQRQHPRFSHVRATMFKGLFQCYGLRLWTQHWRPFVTDKLLAVPAQNPDQPACHCAAAEILGGLLRATKHWRFSTVEHTWQDVLPLLVAQYMPCTAETKPTWLMCLQYAVYRRDVRRFPWLFDTLLKDLWLPTLSASMWSVQLKRLQAVSTVVHELSYASFGLLHRELVPTLMVQLDHPSPKVRRVVSLLLQLYVRTSFLPRRRGKLPLLARAQDAQGAEVVAQLCGVLDAAAEASPVANPGERDGASEAAEQARVRRCKTVVSFFADLSRRRMAVAMSDLYAEALPRLAALLAESDVELAVQAKGCLAAVAVSMMSPRAARRVVQSLAQVVQSPSWHVRGAATTIGSDVLFVHLFSLSRTPEAKAFDELVEQQLYDTRVEVRTQASQALSSGLQMHRGMDAVELVAHFCAQLEATTPIRSTQRTREARDNLVKRHGAVLGLAAVIRAFPYDCPEWFPQLLTRFARFVAEPTPVRTTVKTAFSQFWRTHQDEWEVFKLLFSEDELYTLTQLLVSPSYFA